MPPTAVPVPARFVFAGLGAGAVLIAGAILWIGNSMDARDERARPAPEWMQRRAPEASSSEAVAVPTPDERPFLDAASSGMSAYEDGNYSDALSRFREAVHTNPNDAESHSNLGQVLVKMGQPLDAIPHFDRAIALNGSRWAYHFNRARALGLLNRWEESVAGYRAAQRLFPDDYATTFNLAQALHRSGDEESAVEQYLRAIELAPEDASFRMALGISYERLQQNAAAAAAYAEYLRLASDASDAERVRAKIAQLTGQ